MAKFSLWQAGPKTADYRFIDSVISEFFYISGTAVYCHLYLGPHEQDGTVVDSTNTASTIQDVLFLENRDRKYSEQIYELRGTYNVADANFDLRQFGLFLQGDTLFIEFHMNDMFAQLGRRLMAGDVIELPHQRDDMMLDPNAPAANKFYVIEDANRAADGYSSTWYPHIWRIKAIPLTASQEYSDILNKPSLDPFGRDTNTSIGDAISTIGIDLGINDDIVEAARLSVSKRNFETQQFYVIDGEGGENGSQYPWIFTGDGLPPNGAQLLGTGTSFPSVSNDKDYFLRTDYSPHTLFRRNGVRWEMQEIDYRGTDFSTASRLLLDFVNNNKITTFDNGNTEPEKQGLSKVVKARPNF